VKLKSSLSVFQRIVMAVSLVIGSGRLGLPGLALEAGGIAAASAGWVVTTVASLPFIFILTRLGLHFRSSAGLAHYAEAGVGRWASSGVVAVLVGTFAIGIPALAIIEGAYAQRLFGPEMHHQYWLALCRLRTGDYCQFPLVLVAGQALTHITGEPNRHHPTFLHAAVTLGGRAQCHVPDLTPDEAAR